MIDSLDVFVITVKTAWVKCPQANSKQAPSKVDVFSFDILVLSVQSFVASLPSNEDKARLNRQLSDRLLDAELQPFPLHSHWTTMTSRGEAQWRTLWWKGFNHTHRVWMGTLTTRCERCWADAINHHETTRPRDKEQWGERTRMSQIRDGTAVSTSGRTHTLIHANIHTYSLTHTHTH